MSKKTNDEDKNQKNPVLPPQLPMEPDEPRDDYYETHPDIARFLEMIESDDYYKEDEEDEE